MASVVWRGCKILEGNGAEPRQVCEAILPLARRARADARA
jgi:hypothetical protein